MGWQLVMREHLNTTLDRARTIVRLLVSRWSFRGKSRLLNTFESCLARLGGVQRPLQVYINGLPMKLDLRLSAHRDMYYGLYEEAEIRFMRRCLDGNSVFMDVGASEGYYVAQAAGVISKHGSIHCFEPNSAAFTLLRRSVEASELNVPVFLNLVAVSDTTGTVQMVISGGKSHVLDVARSAAKASRSEKVCEVKTITLDEYIEHNGIKQIDFIKLDIEGHELWALRSLSKYLEAGGRPTILTEVRWDLLPAYREELFSFMESFGFEAYRFERTRMLPVQGPDALRLKSSCDADDGRTSLNIAWVYQHGAAKVDSRGLAIGR